jgi:hypothetical protein
MPNQFAIAFKSSHRSHGQRLFDQEKVYISSHSDQSIQASVRSTPPARMTIESDLQESMLHLKCSCSSSMGCKHLWAVMLAIQEKHPDFFEGKTGIDFMSESDSDSTVQDTRIQDSKKRASDYRKDQYQKFKQKMKEKKSAGSKKNSSSPSRLPLFSEELKNSLDYFLQNGFPMQEGPSAEVLTEAKRKLSRIFHPDKGGSHQETVELNHHCQVIQDFLLK